MAKLVCYRKYCSCKYANVHEQSEICSSKLKTLLKLFDKLARCRRGNFDGLFVGLLTFGKDL